MLPLPPPPPPHPLSYKLPVFHSSSVLCRIRRNLSLESRRKEPTWAEPGIFSQQCSGVQGEQVYFTSLSNSPERALGIDKRLSCTKGSSTALTSRRGTEICRERKQAFKGSCLNFVLSGASMHNRLLKSQLNATSYSRP